MKRALKEKVKAVLENTPSDDAPVEHLNAVNLQINRRVPRKAAMIGLAISMGATSLLVTRQGDQAQAAAPVGNQNTASTLPVTANTEVKFAAAPKLESEGATQVPRLGAKLEVAIRENVVLTTPVVKTTTTIENSVNLQPQVGQSLRIPSTSASKQESDNLAQRLRQLPRVPVAAPQNISLNTQPQTLDNSIAAEVNPQLKAQQEFALNKLQEKSSRLRASLTQWREQENKSSQTATELTPETTAVETTPGYGATNTTSQSKALSNKAKASLVSRLKQANVGNVPTIPIAAPTSAIPARTTIPGPTAYEVKPGDTLAAIATSYGTSVTEIVKANNLTDANELQINQKLTVPVSEKPTTVTEPTLAVTPVVPASTKELTTNLSVNPVGVAPTPVTANNSITLPTPVVANNQFQSNTTITPATDLTTAPAYGIGGDSPIPQALTGMQLAKNQPELIRAKNKNPRLRSLQEEIEKLRAKYRAQQSGNVVVPTQSANNNGAVLIPVSQPGNFPVANTTSVQNNLTVPIAVPRPMGPNYSAQPLRPEFRATRPNNDAINPEFLPNKSGLEWTATTSNRPSVRIPVSSVGVDASASLGAMKGRTVSPDLPPLTAAVDRYLPRTIDENTPAPSTMTTAYIWPAKGVLTSGFGRRWGRAHKGIDVANGTGTPIYASADGVIEKAGWNTGGYGNVVDIRHTDGSMTRYGHNSKILVQTGQPVRQGDTIALMGSTGFSTGPHTHFEIHASGKGAVNPVAFLPPRV